MRHAREGVSHIWAGIVDVKKRRKTGEKAAYLDRDRRCREKKKKKEKRRNIWTGIVDVKKMKKREKAGLLKPSGIFGEFTLLG